MSAHIHADLMKQYYEDALETETPWERWERQTRGSNMWTNCTCTPDWTPTTQYRRKRVALCRVEGRDVFPGDKLWWKVEGRWITAVRHSPDTTRGLVLWDNETWYALDNLTWTEPAKTKTVYQWAMRQGDRWFCSSTMVADKVEMVANFPNFTDFRRLDWTAMEVPA